jgi:hypothetical protein
MSNVYLTPTRKARTSFIRIALVLGYMFVFGCLGIMLTFSPDSQMDTWLFFTSASLLVFSVCGAIWGSLQATVEQSRATRISNFGKVLLLGYLFIFGMYGIALTMPLDSETDALLIFPSVQLILVAAALWLWYVARSVWAILKREQMQTDRSE